ncbi:MAG: hypothetical protein GY799_25420 [Desulfobulbaceae bacterium]|nr:hypothetical protein [Desulfobulbaceae bacterium]
MVVPWLASQTDILASDWDIEKETNESVTNYQVAGESDCETD